MRPCPPALACAVALAATSGPPAARGAGAPEPATEAIVAELPFREGDEPNRVVVDLAPEGSRPLVLMLDTSASASLVTPRMARELGVSVRRHETDPYRRATRLGRDLHFWIDSRRSDTGSKTGWEYGLLGGDFLDDYVVEIDFPGRRVRFLDPRRYRVPEAVDAPDERVLAFERAGTRIQVPVELAGRRIPVMFDTGVPTTLILSGAAARSLGIDVDALPAFGVGGTLLGPMEQRFYEAAEFRFAGFDYAPLPTIVAPRGWYNLAGNTDSAIGYDVLRPFVVRIDYPRERLWLARRGDPRVTFLGGDYEASKRIGALLVPHAGRLHVYRVFPDGLAARYGLREADAIVPALGDRPPTLAEVIAKLETRGELTVARRAGDVWIDLVLPEDPPPEAAEP